MRFSHGSAQKNIADTEFSLFDYKVPINEKPGGCIDNGLDASGPGIYAFVMDGDEKQALRGAASYAGLGGTVYLFNVDIEPEALANRRDPDEIPEELWAEVVEQVIDARRRGVGYDEARLRTVLEPFSQQIEAGEAVDTEAVKSALADFGTIYLEYYDPAEASDGQEWLESVVEDYALNNDPCANVMEEGGPEGIARYAIEASDDLWGTLCKVWERCAVETTGRAVETYNKTFQSAVQSVLPEEYAITAAMVDGGRFAVIFDTSAIRMERQIDCQKSADTDISLG